MNDDCAKVPRCFGAFVKTATQFVISWQQKSMFDEEASQKEEASGNSSVGRGGGGPFAVTAAFCSSGLFPLRNSPAEEVTLKNALSQTRRSGLGSE